MSQKILVVDDDPIMMQFVSMGLKDKGYEVIVASDGEEGLRMTREHKPALLVLDLAMPKMHGYEVCKSIRADPSLQGTKIIVTSGKNYAVDIRTAKEVGADRYLVKPYQIQELVGAIQELLPQA